MKEILKRSMSISIFFIVIMIFSISSPVFASLIITDTEQSNGSGKGKSVYSYYYEYNESNNSLELIQIRSTDKKTTNAVDYNKKYGKIPSVNSQALSGTDNVSGIYIKGLDNIPYEKAHLEKVLKEYGDKNWKLDGKRLPVEKGNKVIKIDLNDFFPPDYPDPDIPEDEEDPDPPEDEEDPESPIDPEDPPKPPVPLPPSHDKPEPKNGEYTKTEVDNVWRLESLRVATKAEEYNVISDKINYNKNKNTNSFKSEYNSLGSAEQAYGGVPDLNIEEKNPTYYYANSKSEARYIEIIRVRHYERSDRYESCYHDDTDRNGNDRSWSHQVWAGYTPWSLSNTEYMFGSSTIDTKANTHDSKIKLPEMKTSNILDLNSESYSSISTNSFGGHGSSRIKEGNGKIDIKAKLIDRSGIPLGNKFELTSENIPRSFTLTNSGWMGITTDFGDNLSLGNESPGGTLYDQFISKTEMYYGATNVSESPVRASIELIKGGIDGTSLGENIIKSKTSAVNVAEASSFSTIAFKLRSIKAQAEDYNIGNIEFPEGIYVLATSNRHNQEGYNYISFAAGNSVSHIISTTEKDYNKIILVSDFIQPYLKGAYKVKDAAGHE